MLAKVDVILPHQLFISSQTSQQGFVSGPFPRSIGRGFIVLALQLGLEAVGAGVGFVAFYFATGAE